MPAGKTFKNVRPTDTLSLLVLLSVAKFSDLGNSRICVHMCLPWVFVF